MGDPIIGAVVAIVMFLVSIPLGFWVPIIGFGALGASLSEGAAAVGMFFGWLVGIAWAVFALINAVLQIIRLIQLLT